MKKSTLWIFVLILQSSLGFGQIKPIRVGATMPKQTEKMLDISGKEINLQGASKGNGILVIFISNACVQVDQYENRITNLIDFSNKLNIGMLLINSNEAARKKEESIQQMQAYAIDKRINCYYALDTSSAVANAFGASKTPECFLFDKQYNLIYHGAIDDNAMSASAVSINYLTEAMTALASGKTIQTNETKVVGCRIKRKPKG